MAKHQSAVKASISTLFLLVTIMLPGVINGHGSGASIEKQVDEVFLVDIGFAPENLVANRQARLDFSLLDFQSNEPVPFTDIWLRIEKDEELYFAGGIDVPEFGDTVVSYRFSETGVYSVFVRYQNDLDAITETSIDLTVQPDPNSSTFYSILDSNLIKWLIAFALLSIMLCIVLLTRSGLFNQKRDTNNCND